MTQSSSTLSLAGFSSLSSAESSLSDSIITQPFPVISDEIARAQNLAVQCLQLPFSQNEGPWQSVDSSLSTDVKSLSLSPRNITVLKPFMALCAELRCSLREVEADANGLSPRVLSSYFAKLYALLQKPELNVSQAEIAEFFRLLRLGVKKTVASPSGMTGSALIHAHQGDEMCAAYCLLVQKQLLPEQLDNLLYLLEMGLFYYHEECKKWVSAHARAGLNAALALQRSLPCPLEKLESLVALFIDAVREDKEAASLAELTASIEKGPLSPERHAEIWIALSACSVCEKLLSVELNAFFTTLQKAVDEERSRMKIWEEIEALHTLERIYKKISPEVRQQVVDNMNQLAQKIGFNAMHALFPADRLQFLEFLENAAFTVREQSSLAPPLPSPDHKEIARPQSSPLPSSASLANWAQITAFVKGRVQQGITLDEHLAVWRAVGSVLKKEKPSAQSISLFLGHLSLAFLVKHASLENSPEEAEKALAALQQLLQTEGLHIPKQSMQMFLAQAGFKNLFHSESCRQLSPAAVDFLCRSLF